MVTFRSITLSIALALSLLPTFLMAKQPERIGNRVKGRLIVRHVESEQNAEKQAIKHGATVSRKIRSIKTLVLEVPEPALENVRNALLKSGQFELVEPDYIAEAVDVPNDPMVASQWHIQRISLPGAWSLTTGIQSVPIAVIDSGIDRDHPDLAGKILAGYNFVNGNDDTEDLLGHGTATAGAAAAVTNNALGVAGAAWDNPIIPVVALNGSNWATYSDITSAIIWATQHGARVISISIAGTSYSSMLESAVNYAWDNGVVVFAAAGNAGSAAPSYPAACERAVAVASIGSSDVKSGWSNYGNWIALTAPGENIMTAVRGGSYATKSGTSFSTPLAAGVAGLVISANPNLFASEVVALIQENADDLGDPGFDPLNGWGRVNAERSVAAALGLSREPPPDSEPEPQPEPEPDPEPADMEEPSVRITSPQAGANIKLRVVIKAAASDNVGVVKMAIQIDGKEVFQTTNSSLAYTHKNLSSGSHTIAVTATDQAGNTGVQSISVTR